MRGRCLCSLTLLSLSPSTAQHVRTRGGSSVTRTIVTARTTTSAAAITTTTLHTTRRGIHTQPFSELAADASQGEAYEAARDALLQLNLMIRSGVEPDALMYTSLIAVMARAGLEWQAYKLFSRMIEMHVRPLPETYVALLDATAPQRTTLREQIRAKMTEAMELVPTQLAEDELARRRAGDQQCIDKFDEYMRGTLPPSTAATPSLSDDAQQLQQQQGADARSVAATASDTALDKADTDSTRARAHDGGRSAAAATDASTPVATMRIRNPTDAWHTAQLAEQVRGAARARAAGEAAAELRLALGKLHEEELRIYLAVQRQLRHGSKEQLIARVLEHVSEHAIRDMLRRRARYFGAVGEVLRAELYELHAPASEADAKAASQHHASAGDDDHAVAAAAATIDKAATTTATRRDASAGDAATVACATAATLSPAERDDVAGEVLRAPWGLLRKPQRRRAVSPSPPSRDRLERVRLSSEELLLVQHKAHTKELDELPDSLLRRYAFMFQLQWRRRQPLSLLTAVEWHAVTFLRCTNNNNNSNEASTVTTLSRAAVTTPALRLQMERGGVQRTLANYDAFRIIAQRTRNLQVVDHAEVNVHLRRTHSSVKQQQRVADTLQRRERNILTASALAAAARSYTPPQRHDDTSRHVLGLEQHTTHGSDNHDADKDVNNGRSSSSSNNGSGRRHDKDTMTDGDEGGATAVVGELPPWALTSGEDEFDLRSGRFGGDERVGRYRELSDSRVRLLPRSEAQQRWAVDWQLLPAQLRDRLYEAELQQHTRHDAVEREYAARMRHARYRKWDALLASAQAKKAAAKRRQQHSGGDDKDAAAFADSDVAARAVVKPLPPRRRYAQLLRKGAERQAVSDELRARYTRSL